MGIAVLKTVTSLGGLFAQKSDHPLADARGVRKIISELPRDNAFKARIKILVKALGREEFARQVEAEWAHLKDGPATLTVAEVERVAAQFVAPAYETLAEDDLCHLTHLREDKAFSRWVERNVQAHKVAGWGRVLAGLCQQPAIVRVQLMARTVPGGLVPAGGKTGCRF